MDFFAYLVPFIVALIRFFTLLLAVYNTLEFVACLPDIRFFRYDCPEKSLAMGFREKMGKHISAASFGWALFVMMAMYKGS